MSLTDEPAARAVNITRACDRWQVLAVDLIAQRNMPDRRKVKVFTLKFPFLMFQVCKSGTGPLGKLGKLCSLPSFASWLRSGR